jgi:DNA polymerase-3 subunit epsilon
MPRPNPLAAKLTKEDAAAHDAFIGQLGDGAVWNKLIS